MMTNGENEINGQVERFGQLVGRVRKKIRELQSNTEIHTVNKDPSCIKNLLSQNRSILFSTF